MHRVTGLAGTGSEGKKSYQIQDFILIPYVYRMYI